MKKLNLALDGGQDSDLLESVYEECLCHELNEGAISFERQKSLTLRSLPAMTGTGRRVCGAQLR